MTKIRKKPYIIYPNNIYKRYWDILVALLLVISVITTPIDLAFPLYSEKNDGYSDFIYLIDFLFLIDIILNFNSAFENNLLELEDDRKAIVINYLKLWFFIDFFSIFPFEYIFK
jgi:hypothetical protein